MGSGICRRTECFPSQFGVVSFLLATPALLACEILPSPDQANPSSALTPCYCRVSSFLSTSSLPTILTSEPLINSKKWNPVFRRYGTVVPRIIFTNRVDLPSLPGFTVSELVVKNGQHKRGLALSTSPKPRSTIDFIPLNRE